MEQDKESKELHKAATDWATIMYERYGVGSPYAWTQLCEAFKGGAAWMKANFNADEKLKIAIEALETINNVETEIPRLRMTKEEFETIKSNLQKRLGSDYEISSRNCEDSINGIDYTAICISKKILGERYNFLQFAYMMESEDNLNYTLNIALCSFYKKERKMLGLQP